nr:hypothetical protein [Methanobacterium formicicum]
MRFIIIDGLDGSGKSTQAKLVQKKILVHGGKCYTEGTSLY